MKNREAREIIRMVALSRLKSRKTGDDLYRVSLKKHSADGLPRMAEFWIDKSVGEECLRMGLIEDVDVYIEAGLDEFMRLTITKILPAEDVLDSNDEIQL